MEFFNLIRTFKSTRCKLSIKINHLWEPEDFLEKSWQVISEFMYFLKEIDFSLSNHLNHAGWTNRQYI